MLILLFALAPLPAPLPAVPRHVDTLKNHTLMGVKCEDGDWARQLAMTRLLLNPCYLLYIAVCFTIGVAMFLLLLEVFLRFFLGFALCLCLLPPSPSMLYRNSVPR